MAMTARIVDNNGWFEIRSNPISKVGVFPYRGDMINGPDPNKIYNVYRPAAELSNPDTLKSFRLLPFIDGHVMLAGKGREGAPGYVPAERKGIHGVLGEQIVFDDNTGLMLGNIKVFSTAMDAQIENGKIDLSLGYTCSYVPESGVYNGQHYDYVQKNIRGNHLALVQNGRMGSDVAVMDEVSFTFDNKDVVKMPLNTAWINAMMQRMTVIPDKKAKDGSLVTTAAMDAADVEANKAPVTVEDITAVLKSLAPKFAVAMDDCNDDDEEDDDDDDGKPVMDEFGKPKKKANGMDKKAAAAMDAAIKSLQDEIAALKATKSVGMDQASMDAAIAAKTAPLNAQIDALKNDATKTVLAEISQRDTLAHRVSQFVGTFDHREMTMHDVAKYAVEKLKVPAVVNQELSAINAWLHGRKPATPTFALDQTVADDGKSPVDEYFNRKV